MKSRSLGDSSGVARGGVLVMRDISSSKRSQELVRRLSSVVEQTGDSIIIYPPRLVFGVGLRSTAELSLEPGDLMMLFTDGITEAENHEGVVFGTERVLEFVSSHRHESSHDIVHGLCLAVRRFTGSTPQNDDVTAIVCKATSPSGTLPHS